MDLDLLDYIATAGDATWYSFHCPVCQRISDVNDNEPTIQCEHCQQFFSLRDMQQMVARPLIQFTADQLQKRCDLHRADTFESMAKSIRSIYTGPNRP